MATQKPKVKTTKKNKTVSSGKTKAVKKKPAVKKPKAAKKKTTWKKATPQISEAKKAMVMTSQINEEILQTAPSPFDLNDLPTFMDEEAAPEIVQPEPPKLPEPVWQNRASFYIGVFLGAVVIHTLVLSVLVWISV